MSFSRAKSTGWTDNVDTITAAEMNQIDVNQSRALDGTAGGIYTPSAALDIRGTAGVIINGTGSATRLRYGSRSLTRTQDGMLVNIDTAVTSFTPISIGVGQQGIQMLERIPNGATLTLVSAYHDSGSATPPVTPVAMTVTKTDITTGTTTVVDTSSDTTAGAAYGAHHRFDSAVLSLAIDRTKFVYKVVFDGEAGGGSSATNWFGCTCTFTVTDQDEAA